MQAVPKETPRAYVLRQWQELELERSPFVPLWRDLAEYFAPRRGRFLPEDKDKRADYDSILDTSPTTAARTLAAGMVAGVTSPTRPWFQLVISDPKLRRSYDVRRWLSMAQAVVLETLHRSNFYSVVQGFYFDAAVFGTGAMLLLEDAAGIVRAHHLPIGSYSIATSASGRVDTLIRRRRFTVAQLVEEFGLEAVSAGVARDWRARRYSREVTVLHLIEPRHDREHGRRDARNMPFRSVWVEESGDAKEALRESGYQTFPGVALRWDTIGEDAWGFGPGEETLGDAKQLQLAEEWALEAIEKHVRPPLNAAQTLEGKALGLHPSDVNFGAVDTGGRALVAPTMQTQPITETLEAKQAQVRARIARAFFSDLFRLMLDLAAAGGKMTAREVEERSQERMLMLGPVLERIDDDVTEVVIPRVLSLALDRGLLASAPLELSGAEYAVENISIFAQAQKRSGLVPIRELAAFAAEMGAINPEALDVLDPVAAVELAAEITGADARVLRDPADVRAQRELRAAQQQAQQQAAQAEATANVAAQGARAVKDASGTFLDSALRRTVDPYQ